MALLKDVFAKKTFEPMQRGGVSDVPTEKVLVMREQGLSSNQIVEALQREGYPLDLINNAVNQADIKEGVLTPQKGDIMPNMPPPMQGPGQMGPPPAMGPMQMPMPQMGPMQQGYPEQTSNEDRIQEIAEAIIDEKWSELISNVNKVIEWKDVAETRIAKIEQQLSDIKGNFDRLHEGVLGKLTDYDKGIREVGVEIKALEKVFQKVLPGFIENVNELSRITSTMKKQPFKK
ncbi:hypothetical protein COV19_03650 [Candidatus Woesearchaeota archaeon CG10_big_fil_rev_8_21_14_0_10_44_13]|nr:MAG: hypothetical protein COV19_03650 [Candidatus Woesearchaeota archaeon CG10_big_fil_rev_8_21_14_0_10_44_13]